MSAKHRRSFDFRNQLDLSICIKVIFFCSSFNVQLRLRVKRNLYEVLYQWFCVVSSSCIFLGNHSYFLIVCFYCFNSVIIKYLLLYFIWQIFWKILLMFELLNHSFLRNLFSFLSLKIILIFFWIRFKALWSVPFVWLAAA